MPLHHNPLPWRMPTTAPFAITGVFASDPMAPALQTRHYVGWLIVVGLAMIASATLVPLYGTFEGGASGSVGRGLSIMTPATLADFVAKDDLPLTVLLLMPLGCLLGLLPWPRRTRLVAIETTQEWLPVPPRACQSSEVIDNISELLVGAAGGAVAAVVVDRLSRLVRLLGGAGRHGRASEDGLDR